MKRKIVTVILGSAIMLSVVACGTEETVQTMNTDTVVEENVSDETIVEENVTEEIKEEIEEVVVKEEVYEPLSQDNIIKLDDGTYDFTDEFIGTAMGYDFFKDSTEQEVKEYLNEVIDTLIGLDPEGISEALGDYEKKSVNSFTTRYSMIIMKAGGSMILLPALLILLTQI